MAFGLHAGHTSTIFRNDLNTDQLLALSVLTAQQLGWTLNYISRSGFIAHANNGDMHYSAEITFRMIHGVASVTSISGNRDVFDWGKNKKILAPFIDAMEIKKSDQQKEDLSNLYYSLSERFETHHDDKLKQAPPSGVSIFRGFIAIFLPSEDYVITPILLNINLLIFVIMVLSGVDIMEPSGENLIAWGSNFSPVTLEGEWWRLLTCCFLHIGLLHLLMNMYALLYIGLLLEPILGKARFLAAYLLTGIIASFASLWWHDIINSAGASGAIFGLYGVFLALLTTPLLEKDARKTLMSSIGIFVIYNLINGMKGGVDNAAHIGGLMSGLIIGYAMIPSLKQNSQTKVSLITILLLSVVSLSTIGFIYAQMPNSIKLYEEKMKTFSELELKTIGIDTLERHTRKDFKLAEIKDKGIPAWTKNKALLEEISHLKLPYEPLYKNNLLKKYSDLRLKSLDLMYKSIEENTNRYNTELDSCNHDMENIIHELNKPKTNKE